MRKLVALLVVLVALVAIDRVAVAVAENQIADRVQQSQGLAGKPDVTIGGFPFLTQVVRGRYQQVSATVPGVERDGLRLDSVRVDASGVRVDLGDLVSGSVRSIPVDHARGQVLLSYADLNAYLASRVQGPTIKVSNSGSNLRVTGTVQIPVLDRSVSASGTARVDISGDNVTLLPTAVETASGLLPDFAQSAAQEALTIRFRVNGLPFGVRLNSARVTDDGIVFDASADGLTLDTGSLGG